MGWLSDVPVLLALPLFAVTFAAAAVLAHTLLRPLLPPPERLSEHHEVPGFLMGVVGVLYSVVLGFLVGTVWTAFATAQQTMDLQAGYVGDAFNFASKLETPQRRELQRLLARYAIEVSDAKGPIAQNGVADRTGALLLRAVDVTLTVPAAARSANSARLLEGDALRSSLLDALRNVGDTRRLSLVQSTGRLPPGMLEALILGAIGVIAFTFLFGVRSYVKQMTMTALLAGSIGLFFGLVVELSTPYSGPIHVSRDAWTFVIDSNHLDAFAK